jgi:hypothetical protein
MHSPSQLLPLLLLLLWPLQLPLQLQLQLLVLRRHSERSEGPLYFVFAFAVARSLYPPKKIITRNRPFSPT